MVGGIRRRSDVAVAAQARQHGLFVAQFDIQCVDEDDRRGLARVVAAAKDRVADQVVRGYAQASEHGRAQVGVGMVEGQLEFGQAHGVVATVGGEIDILAMTPAHDPKGKGCGPSPGCVWA